MKAELTAQKTILNDKETMEIDYDRLNKRLDLNADVEIDDMKLKYAQRLKHEEDTVMLLMSEHAVLKKSLQTLGKDASRQKDEIRRLAEREARLFDTVHSLEKDIVNHKKEIREREETITDKEKRIFDLKKKNQELEKFRFVLDYKIKELKMQIAPREEEISTMRKQIEDMDMELAQYHKSNAALNLMISELKLKVEGMRRELLVQTERHAMCGRLVTKYRRDLKDMRAIWDNSVALKMAVINMFRIYVQDDAGSLDSGKVSKKVEDPQLIYNRDREQLERSLDALRRAVKGDATSHNRNVTKMLRENVVLTTELNTLRKDYMALTLKKKAIDESGALNGKPFNDIFDILGTKDPGEKYRKQQAAAAGSITGDPNPNAGGIFATEGVEEMRAPSRGPAGSRSPRTVALRATDANGRTRDTSPTSQQQTGVRRGGDQWDAWREIQMQNDQMMQLEEQLRNVCLKMSIDPVQVFKKLEETVAR
jgi:DNA repair exonuclease SbcCD ATPase subunit